MTQPARRVIYRSVKARAIRLLVGVALGAVTLLVVLPVLSSDHSPPEPSGLAIGTDANDIGLSERGPSGIRASVLDLTVHASGCKNPATITGSMIRSTNTWFAERNSQSAASPQRAMITLAGARVRGFQVGLEGEPAGSQRLESGTVRMLGLRGGSVTVHRELLPLVRSGDATTALFIAHGWQEAMSPLDFVIYADLIHPAGFNSCYVSLPEIFPFSTGTEKDAIGRAESAQLTLNEHISPPIGSERLGAGVVDVSVATRIVSPNTVREGGRLTPSGVRYLCHSFIRAKPPVEDLDSRISPEFNEAENPNCSGVPLFQAVDVTSDTTRRLFIAGIVGALAATLILEALFFGETDDTGRGASSGPRRKWRAAP